MRKDAAGLNRRILLPEPEDPRVISAACFLSRHRIARPVFVGEEARVRASASTWGIPLERVETEDLTSEERRRHADLVFEKRKAKGGSPEEAFAWLQDPLHRAAVLLREGRGDGFLGGAVRSTADTVRALLAHVGMAEGVRVGFGAFLMECPHAAHGTRRLLFSDAAVSPHPSPRALSAVAMGSAAFFRRVTGEVPRVAFLSFSTKGSAEDESVSMVREALALVKSKSPDLAVDGEFQADAALVDHIAAQKGVTDSAVAGRANVLVFPDLNAGNIGYKLVQHLGGARAVGPVLVGLARPAADLSRGCTDEDIVDAAALVSVMSGSIGGSDGP